MRRRRMKRREALRLLEEEYGDDGFVMWQRANGGAWVAGLIGHSALVAGVSVRATYNKMRAIMTEALLASMRRER